MHLNIPLMERDNLRAMSKVFSDPSAQRVFHLRRRALSKQAIILAGAHFHAGNYLRTIRMVIKSTVLWPPNALYLLGFPWRYWNRTFSDQRTGRPRNTNVRPFSAVTSSSAMRCEASTVSGRMETLAPPAHR